MDGSKRKVFNEFFNLVDDMRQAQRNYFARRTGDNLIKSKHLERAVDELIKKIRNGSAFQIQLELGI